MMKNKKPVIRFKGFSEEWKEKELGNEVDFFNGLTYSPTNIVKVDGTLVLRSSNVKNGEIVYDDNVYVNSNVVNSENVKVGDIVVVVRNGSRSLIGKHAQIKQSLENTVIGAFMTGIHCQQPTFINALLDTVQYNKEIEKNLGATINQITTGAFKKMIFKFPQSIEQTQIGNFFKNLDNLITLHQRKYEKLGILKKAMLEKMFPKNGANVPEIRFKGFEEAWEERRLGEILTEMRRSIVLEDNKIYELVTVKRRNQGVVSRGLMKGKDILVKNYFEVREGDYIISKRQVIHGANGIVPKSLDRAIVSNEYLVCVENENITAEYLTIISNLPDMYKKFFLSSYGVDIEKLVFDVEDWKKRSIIIPSLTEQKRITGYFKNLDDLLRLHEKELEKLKNLKKALLEKMFV